MASSYPPIPTAQDLSNIAASPSSSNWAKFYAFSETVFGITKFNQAVPMIISSVAVGTSIVNRNFPKCIGHLGGATIVGLIMSTYNAFTTAFLAYTIVYVSFCMSQSKSIDANSLISIIISFIILVFVNLVTVIGGIGVSVRDYIVGTLAGVAFGIGGFYLTLSVGGKAALYDFSGCSCDDCDSKCPVGSKTQMVMAKQISETPSN
jgi:hypothetical protein